MKLSILLPVYNEEANLERLLMRLLAVNVEKEVIAVDDCSRDRSRDILAQYAERGVKTVFHQENQGKGGAVRTALAHATGDYVIIQDADNELDPNDIPRLMQPVLEGKAQVVYGARNLRVQSLGNYLGNKFLTIATNLLFGTRVSDMETCYKLIPREVMQSLELKSHGFDIEPEITAKLGLRGYKIAEVPISYAPRVEDKKMRPIRDGLHALEALIRLRLNR